MKVTPQELEEATILSEKYPCILALINHYNFFTNNQVYESLIARMVIINKWNEDLLNNPISIVSPKYIQGKNEKEIAEAILKTDKEIDRILKFMEKQPQLLEGTEVMKQRLTPEEKSRSGKDNRIKSGSGDIVFGD